MTFKCPQCGGSEYEYFPETDDYECDSWGTSQQNACNWSGPASACGLDEAAANDDWEDACKVDAFLNGGAKWRPFIAVCSQDACEAMRHVHKHIIISITDPPPFSDGQRAKLWSSPECLDVLHLQFGDYHKKHFTFSHEGQGLKTWAMNQSHASCVREFLTNWHGKYTSLIIHCSAGVSRSPSMALAIAEWYGVPRASIEPVTRDWSVQPLNPWVYEQTKKALTDSPPPQPRRQPMNTPKKNTALLLDCRDGDLVRLLRETTVRYYGNRPEGEDVTLSICRDAADEIERLRAVLDTPTLPMPPAETDVRQVLADNPVAPTFTPYVYRTDSGAIHACFSQEADYSEKLTDEITLYRSLENKEIVGCRLEMPAATESQFIRQQATDKLGEWDARQVDDDFLKSIGFEWDDEIDSWLQFLPMERNTGKQFPITVCGTKWIVGPVAIPTPKTCNDVRRLLALLGVPGRDQSGDEPVLRAEDKPLTSLEGQPAGYFLHDGYPLVAELRDKIQQLQERINEFHRHCRSRESQHQQQLEAILKVPALTDQQNAQLISYANEYFSRGINGVWHELAMAIVAALKQLATVMAERDKLKEQLRAASDIADDTDAIAKHCYEKVDASARSVQACLEESQQLQKQLATAEADAAARLDALKRLQVLYESDQDFGEKPADSFRPKWFRDAVESNAGKSLLEEVERLRADLEETRIANRNLEAAWLHEQDLARQRGAIISAAASRVKKLSAELDQWNWLADMGLVVCRNSIVGKPAWSVIDVDDETHGHGDTPLLAIVDAHNRLTSPEPPASPGESSDGSSEPASVPFAKTDLPMPHPSFANARFTLNFSGDGACTYLIDGWDNLLAKWLEETQDPNEITDELKCEEAKSLSDNDRWTGDSWGVPMTLSDCLGEDGYFSITRITHDTTADVAAARGSAGTGDSEQMLATARYLSDPPCENELLSAHSADVMHVVFDALKLPITQSGIGFAGEPLTKEDQADLQKQLKKQTGDGS